MTKSKRPLRNYRTPEWRRQAAQRRQSIRLSDAQRLATIQATPCVCGQPVAPGRWYCSDTCFALDTASTVQGIVLAHRSLT